MQFKKNKFNFQQLGETFRSIQRQFYKDSEEMIMATFYEINTN